jgi:hypothetical protein
MESVFHRPTLSYAIFIKMIRVGRLTNFASMNKKEFYIQARDMLQHQIQRAIPQMARSVHKQIIGETDSTYGITGIGSAIGSMTNTYAGIDRTGATYFAPYVNHNSNTNRSLTEALLLDVYDTLTEDRDSEPEAIWAGVTAWNAMAKLLGTSGATANYYITQDPNKLNGGAVDLIWKGIPVKRMRGMDANHMYFLNTDFIKYRPHAKRNMVPIGGERMSVNQDAMVKLVGFAGNLTLSNALLQGVLIA